MQPTAYSRQFELTSYSTLHPDDPYEASHHDDEFNAILTTLTETLANLALLQRDDGSLTNGIVTPDALSTAAKALIGAGNSGQLNWTPTGNWATATDYEIGDVVQNTSGSITTSYVAAEDHTSGTLSTDVAAGKWVTLGATTTGAASTISFSATGTIAATDVQAAIAEVALEALQVSNNLSDVASVTSARTNLSVPSQFAIQAQTHNSSQGQAGSTADTLIGTYSPAITTLADRMLLLIQPNIANATATPTFTPNDGVIAARTIVKGNDQPLVAGDITGGFAGVLLMYNEQDDKWVLLNPATAAGSLSLIGGTMTGDLTMSGANVDEAHGADIASATTLNLEASTGNLVDVTGTTTITAITLSEGHERTVRFTGALLLTHNAAIILPGAASITTAAGDFAVFRGYAAGVVRCVHYERAAGLPALAREIDGHIGGLVQSQDTDADHDTAISAGVAVDDTGAYVMRRTAVLTKQIDAAWAVGDDAGGLDGTESVAGTPDADTWYYIWLIARADTGVVDALYSESATTPTMPAGYDYKRLIGAVLTDGSANITDYTAYEHTGGGLDVHWAAAAEDVDVANTLTTSRRTDTMTVPTAFSTIAKVRVNSGDSGANHNGIIQNPDETDLAPDAAASPGINFGGSTTSASPSSEMQIRTSATGTLASRASIATVDSYRVHTVGFIWSRR